MLTPIHRRLLGLAPDARRLLAVAIAAGLVSSVAVVVQAGALARAVDGGAFGGTVPRGAIVALAAAVLVRAAMAAAVEWFGRRAAEVALGTLRRRLSEHVLTARVRRVDEARRGELATAAVHGVDALAEFYARAVPQFALAAVVPAGVVGVLLWQDPLVAILLGLTIPITVVFMVLVGRASAERIAERRLALGVLGSHFLDVVRGLPALRAFGRAAAQADTLGAIGERYRVESVAALRVAFLSALVLELLAMVGTAIAAAVVGVQLASGALTFSTGLFVLLLAPEVYAPLRAAGQRYHAAEDGAAAAATLFEVLDGPDQRAASAASLHDPDRGGSSPAEPRGACAADPARSPLVAEAAGPRGARPGDPARSPLVVDGVVVSGGAGRAPALDGLDATFAPGRLTALVGPSGAGKSTLLSLLAALREPDAGAITCAGRPLGGAAWWPHVAWLDQRPALLRGPLRDTLTFWLPPTAPEHGTGVRREAVPAPGRAVGAPREALDDSEHAAGAPRDAVLDRGRALAVRRGGVDAGAALAVALRRTAADDVVAQLPHGLETRVGAGGRAFAGGQAQRLALAAVLASPAPLLLLDEPTAHLDPAGAALAAAGIREAARGRTAIVATHDPAMLAVADDVVELRAGRAAVREAVAA